MDGQTNWEEIMRHLLYYYMKAKGKHPRMPRVFDDSEGVAPRYYDETMPLKVPIRYPQRLDYAHYLPVLPRKKEEISWETALQNIDTIWQKYMKGNYRR